MAKSHQGCKINSYCYYLLTKTKKMTTTELTKVQLADLIDAVSYMKPTDWAKYKEDGNRSGDRICNEEAKKRQADLLNILYSVKAELQEKWTFSKIMHLLEKIDTRIERELSMNRPRDVEEKAFLLSANERKDLVEILKGLYYPKNN